MIYLRGNLMIDTNSRVMYNRRKQEGFTMKKNSAIATMTHKEIICLAIKAIETEINEYEEKTKGADASTKELIASITKPLYEKSEILKSLYAIESGVEY